MSEKHPTLGSFFREQAVSLAKFNHEVILIYCHVHHVNEGIKPSSQIIDEDGFIAYIDVVHYFIPKTAWIIQLFHTLRMIYSLNKVKSIDIVHAHSFIGGFIAAAACKLFSLPYVVTEHSTIFSRYELSRKDRMMVNIGYKYAGAIIAVSDGLKRDIERFTTKPIKVVYNMVDDKFFDTDISAFYSKEFRFLSVAYLTYKKGMDVLISAMAKVILQHPDCKLSIGGSGDMEEDLHKLAYNLNVHRNIDFLGPLDRDEVIHQMSQCDAFVLASRHETFGIVYLEAMACGKPVIMTDTDAHLTIVQPSTGIVVPRENIDELATAMIELIQNRDSYHSDMIRSYCANHFSSNVIINRIVECYDEVLRGTSHE
jgi:L-malate glycosyltransferase